MRGKRRKILFAFWLVLTSVLSSPQDIDRKIAPRKSYNLRRQVRIDYHQEDQWAKSFGFTQGRMSATSLLRTDDGGYLITATNYLTFPGGWVFKFSDLGILEWSSNAGTTYDRADHTADGGYILAG